ncbi:MAG: type II secretion system F family protein [Nanoarchaeota archaeon]|nr:type II secretion system F family protein [Nanoarchaeota archaeon]
MDLLYAIARKFPQLQHNLRAAHIRDRPQRFLMRVLMLSLYLSIGLSVLFFFMTARTPIPMYLLAIFFPVAFISSFAFFVQSPKVIIRKRKREIEKDVLFAGHYILTKIQSGVPLLNAMIDASKSPGVASKYFREIVSEINTGMPIEKALEKTRDYTASEKFKLILSELVTSLKTGSDITFSLSNVLDQINNDQRMEIKEYGKKLNALIMIYMVLAVAVPSLGMTMFIVIASFMAFELSPIFIIFILVVLFFVQFMFLTLFKSIRPMVNL